MADYRAISTGVYSDLARWEVWNGSAWVAATQLPTIADDVYANSYTVTIDVDSFASMYRTNAITGVLNGGGFILNGGITAIGDRIVGTVGVCMTHSASDDSWAIGDTFGNTVGTALSHGTLCNGTGVLHSVGNATKGSGGGSSVTGGSDGIRSTGSGSFILYGDAIGNTVGFNGSAASNQGGGGLVLGRAIGGTSQSLRGAYNCVVNEIEGRNDLCVVTGKFIMPSNMNTSWVNCFAKSGAPVQIEIYDENGQAVLCNPIAAQGHAAPADVRSGTSYANGALTGSLAVPNPDTVSLGVPTDNTTGTMPTSAVIAADLLNEISTSSNALAERLRNVSTVQTTGTQISALTLS